MHLVLPPSAAPPPRPVFESSTPPANLRSSIFPSQTGRQDSLRLRRPQGTVPVESLRTYLQNRRAETDDQSTTQPQATSFTDTTSDHSNTPAGIFAQANRRAEFSERLRSMTQEVATATRPPGMSINTDDSTERSTTSAGARIGLNMPQPLFPTTTLNREPLFPPINPNRDSVFGMNTQPTQPSETSHRQTLAAVLQRLVAMETQLRGHIAPSVDDISRVRLQLHQLLDEQYRNPLAPREVALESWLARLSTIAIRADQLRINLAQTRSGVTQRVTPATTGSSISHSQMYMISSPDGQYGVAISPAGLSGIQNQPLATVRNSTAGQIPSVGSGHPPVQPVFRAGARATRRPRRRFITALNIFRLTRAVWIFIRLFVVCYLVTSHGTWLRIVSFFAAAFVAVISQTRWPRRARRAVWDPVRRHLENLVPMDDPRAQRPRPRRVVGQAGQPNVNGPTTAIPTNPPPTPDVEAEVAEPTVLGNVRHTLVRAERGVALFLATLVPGIGERYVAARDAADRAREEAERQNEQEENEQRQQQENSETGDSTESDGANTSRASPESQASQTGSSSTQSSDSGVQPPEEIDEQQPVGHAWA